MYQVRLEGASDFEVFLGEKDKAQVIARDLRKVIAKHQIDIVVSCEDITKRKV